MIATTPEILQIARRQAEAMGRLRNSIRQGGGNLDGFVGEAAVKFLLGIPLEIDQNTYDHDIVWHGLSIDVKSKKTAVIPRRHYEASVSDHNPHQRCKIYVHTRVYYPDGATVPSVTYIMGWIEKTEYFRKARLVHRGQINGSNEWDPKCDCWNLAYSDLRPMVFLLAKRYPAENPK
jgi:hypothetical protein